MTAQNYLMVENNIVTNAIVWDGDVAKWQPPADATMLIAATTPAMIWELTTEEPYTYVLVEVMGDGGIGFTWNGVVLTTNQPKPEYTPPEPIPTTTLE